MALWSGRFEKGVSEFTQEFGASLPVDKAMYHQDIVGSRAHVRMLAAQGVTSEKDAEDIVAGLADIEKTIEEGNRTFDINDEDIHMSVEKVLTQNIRRCGRSPAHRPQPQRPGNHQHPSVRQGACFRAHGRRECHA